MYSDDELDLLLEGLLLEGWQPSRVDPLRALAEKEVLKGIHQASLSREAAFSVAGTCSLASGKAVRLAYGGGQLSFPASAEDGAFQALVASCKPASFGKGSETVLDPDCSRALTLGPEDFLTSFSVSQHGLLSHVQRLMMPEAAAVSATLLHFNVYQEGGFFKSHVDTPGSPDMFGSLVVCLPVQHAGGALRVTHGGRTVLHDWGPKSADTIQWAAFYSDCEHEVLPVESGARVTLTYSLSAEMHAHSGQAPGATPIVPALHAALEKAISNCSFMPNGGMFGFPCQHTYPHTSEDVADLDMEGLLKGADAAVVATLRALRLPHEVTRVLDIREHGYCTGDYCDEDADDVYDEDQALMTATLEPADFECLSLREVDGRHYHDLIESYIDEHLGGDGELPGIHWLGGKNAFQDWQVAGAGTFDYGNYADPLDTHIFYCAMGILVTVPPFPDRMRALM